jgi:signal transduction histidine kinase
MRFRTWPLLSAGFGILLLVILVIAGVQQESLEKVYEEVAEIQRMRRQSIATLEQLRSEILLAALFVRDYILETSPDEAENERRTLSELRASMQKGLAELERRARSRGSEIAPGLYDGVVAYWRSIDTVLEWEPAEKLTRGSRFLRSTLVPQRDAVLTAAAQVADLIATETRQREQSVLKTKEELKYDLRAHFGIALLVGLVVALTSIWRIRGLETAVKTHLREIERGALELRRLSQALSAAQEDERKSISRELHDQVGQMITALRMELANLEEFQSVPGKQFARHMAEARSIAEETLRAVRNISTGLRPSVLDELGLGAALKWQAREFARRGGIEVDCDVEGTFDKIPETHKTCVYRVAQEALTNSARHAAARRVRISLRGDEKQLWLCVEDDGVGFDVGQSRGRGLGLGLLGIEERVRELGGVLAINSELSKGTALSCTIPLKKEVSAQ